MNDKSKVHGLTQDGQIITYQQLKDKMYPPGSTIRRKFDKDLMKSLYNCQRTERRMAKLSQKSQLKRYGYAL